MYRCEHRRHNGRPADRAVPSSSVGLDRATGLGGLPRGHLTEFLDPESSSKTTLLYAALAAIQRAGGLVALVDTKGSADGATLAACGVDLDGLLLARPTSARDALLLLTRGLRVLTAALRGGPTAALATNLALTIPYNTRSCQRSG